MKSRKISVMLEFELPARVEFGVVRDYIITELECSGGNRHPSDPLFHSLQNVHVSKPITAWRDPAKKKSSPVKIVDLKTGA